MKQILITRQSAKVPMSGIHCADPEHLLSGTPAVGTGPHAFGGEAVQCPGRRLLMDIDMIAVERDPLLMVHPCFLRGCGRSAAQATLPPRLTTI